VTLHQATFDAEARGPLAALRVVDLSRLVAGNMLSLQLADFGADVVKIEPRGGDTLRNFKSAGLDTWWKTYARNKRSIGLNFRHDDARDVIIALVKTADVFVESFRPGVLEDMGLSPDILLEINPALVIVRISGWGQTGPYRDKPGFGTLVEGYSGFASMNGFADREPALPPIFLGDMVSGLYGFGAVMVALWATRSGGAGQVIDLSLFEPMLSVLGPQAANYSLSGEIKPRTGSRSSTTAPRNVYRSADGGWICLSTSTESMATRLFRAMGRSDLIDGGPFSTVRQRLDAVDEVDRIVGEFIAARSMSENMSFFKKMDITAGPVFDASDLVKDPYVSARQSLVEVDDPDLGPMPMPNVTPRLSRTPGVLRRVAPALGEHNTEILEPLLGAALLESLESRGVLVKAPCTASSPSQEAAQR